MSSTAAVRPSEPTEPPRLVGPMLAAFTALPVGCFVGSLLLKESAERAAPAEGEGAGA